MHPELKTPTEPINLIAMPLTVASIGHTAHKCDAAGWPKENRVVVLIGEQMAVKYQIACLIASTTSLLTSPGALGENLDAEVRQAMTTPGSVKVCGCDLHVVVSNTMTVARLHILQPKPKHSIYTPE